MARSISYQGRSLCLVYGRRGRRIQRHKDFENEHKASRQHLEQSLDRFKEYVVYTMQQGSFEKLAGDEFVFGTRKSEETILHRDPTAQDAEMLPEYVTTKVRLMEQGSH